MFTHQVIGRPWFLVGYETEVLSCLPHHLVLSIEMWNGSLLQPVPVFRETDQEKERRQESYSLYVNQSSRNDTLSLLLHSILRNESLNPAGTKGEKITQGCEYRESGNHGEVV